MDHGIDEEVPSDEPYSSFFQIHARYFFALLFCLLLLQDVFGTHGLMAMHRSKTQMHTIQAQIDKLDQQNRDLQQRIQNLKTDPSAIEKIARDRMGLARPGELIFSLPAKPDAKSAPSSRP
ncbi:MAG: septum formation initiator family protein [Candidatus Acidiferrales bacterium]